MSSVSGVSGYNLYAIQQYQQDLYSQIGNDGSVSESELEQAIGSATGSLAGSGGLYSSLDSAASGQESGQAS